MANSADSGGGGGMRGSDADERPAAPEERKFGKSVRVANNTSTTIDEAALVRAEAHKIELVDAAARLGLDASTRALAAMSDLFVKASAQLVDANAKVATLQAELGLAQSKKKKFKIAKIKAETARHKIDQRTLVIKHAITSLAPGIMPFAPKLALLADKYLPTVLAAARSGDGTPAAAAIRLFVLLSNPDPESDGAQILTALQLHAGAQDWALIQQGMAELAASSPMALAAMSAPSYVGASNGAAHHDAEGN